MKHIETAIQCPQCGTITYIHRRMAKQKKVGHLKKLYCYVCQEEVNQVEVKEPTQFYIDETVNLTPTNKKGDRITCKQKYT